MSATTFVAITGSCGKTTSSALLAHLLDAPSPQKIAKGLNNPYGAARTITGLFGRGEKFAVFEVTGHAPGAVKASTEVIKPDVGIVLVVGLDHTSAFGPIEATADEKMTMVEDLPTSGLAVLNHDDTNIMDRAERSSARVVTFGRHEASTLRLSHSRQAGLTEHELDVVWRDQAIKLRSQLIGEQSVTLILASVLTALELGIEPATVSERLTTFAPLMNRMSLHPLAADRMVVLDAWKAPQWTLATCFEFLEQIDRPRKTIVLGTLSDVRGNTRRRYEQTAQAALAVADRILFVGDEAERVRRLTGPDYDGRLFRLTDVKAAWEMLSADRLPGELLYVKGSRADHLERILHAEHADIACWRYRCGKRFQGCSFCSELLGHSIRDWSRASTLPWLTPQQKLPV